jgi:hypothetical protein
MYRNFFNAVLRALLTPLCMLDENLWLSQQQSVRLEAIFGLGLSSRQPRGSAAACSHLAVIHKSNQDHTPSSWGYQSSLGQGFPVK